MWTLEAVPAYLLGLMIVISVGVIGLRLSRGRRLGPALLKNSDTSQRWLHAVWGLLCLSTILSYLNGESIGSVGLRAAIYAAAGATGWFRGEFSVHAEGIVFGTTVVYWSELEGWSWDAGKRTLLLWSRSWWVRGMTLRPVNGLNTGQGKSVELEALLDRFAGGARRAL